MVRPATASVVELRRPARGDDERALLAAERRRIARELHHHVAPSVVSAELALDRACGDAGRLGAMDTRVLEELETARRLTCQAVTELRHAIEVLHQPEDQQPVQDATTLTAREREVLSLLAHGLSNRDVGELLFISETTAKFHVGNILRKLGVSRRAEAVYEGSKRGVI